MTIVDISNARSLIREILTGQGHKRIFPTRHCRQRMAERQVHMDDIFQVLFWGEISPGAEPGDEEKGIFRISGKDLSDEPLTVVVQINPTDNLLTCISVFWGSHETDCLPDLWPTRGNRHRRLPLSGIWPR
ncbi:MAG: DUF4258 domain-containing protein [Deltaproteobacteria bacterium]|nr:DUF4258 domain-containing protein [Deltaproteobacteria bacterium]